ncbi:MAG: hypothetical protein ACYDB1_00635 [Acidiferrobacteraceae bacterium]
MTDAERVVLLRATLEGVVGMAQLEASQGGSKAWASAANLMQRALDETRLDDETRLESDEETT